MKLVRKWLAWSKDWRSRAIIGFLTFVVFHFTLDKATPGNRLSGDEALGCALMWTVMFPAVWYILDYAEAAESRWTLLKKTRKP